MADSMTRPARPGARPAASASRPSSTASTTASWCSIPQRKRDRRQRRVPAARPGTRASTCSGCCCRDVGPGACPAGDCPTLACLRSRRAAGAHLRASDARRHACDGKRCMPRRSSATTGELLQVVEVWRDISDRRAAEARLAESHRLASLGMLASGFSHELNTPLGNGADVRGGHPARRRRPRRRGARNGRTSGARVGRARADPALPRHHAALPAHVARPDRRRGHRRSAGDAVGRGAADRAHGARPLGADRAAARVRRRCTSAPTRPSCSTS